MIFNRRHTQRGQSIIEFTFAMILTALLLFGVVRIFQWSGLILAEHRMADEKVILNKEILPHQQLEEEYFKPRKMNAIFRFNE